MMKELIKTHDLGFACFTTNEFTHHKDVVVIQVRNLQDDTTIETASADSVSSALVILGNKLKERGF